VFFFFSVLAGRLGSPLLDPLANNCHRLWIAAHLHVLFAAVLPGGARFLALDKPLPGRHFAQWVGLPSGGGERRLRVDGTWLSVLRAGLSSGFFERGRAELPHVGATAEEEAMDCGEWDGGQPGAVTERLLERVGLATLQQMREEKKQHKRLRPDEEREEEIVAGAIQKDPNVLDISE
jgi:hypothetical protein